MKKLAVTGTLAAGKSTVCRLLEQKGAFYVSADAFVSRFLDLRHPLSKRVIELLGSDIITPNSFEFNRKIISERLFLNPDKLALLESIMHPEVAKLIQEAYESAPRESAFFTAEIPLLYEVGWQGWFDKVLFVDASLELRLARFLTRAGAREEDFYARESRFMDLNKKKALADYTLNNASDLSELSKNLDEIVADLLQKTPGT